MSEDWRFQRTKLDPAYTGLDRGYNSRTGALAPAPLTAPVTATSRIIPPPSNTNWNSTFLNNTPASPGNSDWRFQPTKLDPATAAGRSSFSSPPAATPSDGSRRSLGEGGRPFSFDLSGSNDRPQLSLPTSDFQDRAANLDLTTRDHELYGAGKDYGFTY